MSSEVTVILPNVDNDGRSLKVEQTSVLRELLTLAGGYTTSQVSGAWQDSDGTVYRNDSIQASTIVSDETVKVLLDTAVAWCARLRQLSLLVTVRSLDAYFIEQHISGQAAS